MLVFLLVCLLGSCIARLSPRVMVASPAALFASRPSDRPSLLCLFVRRLSGTSPSLVRVVDPSLVFLLESSLSYRCLVARPLGSTGHCVRFGSAVQFYTPRGTAVRATPYRRKSTPPILTRHLYHHTPLVEYILKHLYMYPRTRVFGSWDIIQTYHHPYAHICMQMHSYGYTCVHLHPDACICMSTTPP